MQTTPAVIQVGLDLSPNPPELWLDNLVGILIQVHHDIPLKSYDSQLQNLV